MTDIGNNINLSLYGGAFDMGVSRHDLQNNGGVWTPFAVGTIDAAKNV